MCRCVGIYFWFLVGEFVGLCCLDVGYCLCGGNDLGVGEGVL